MTTHARLPMVLLLALLAAGCGKTDRRQSLTGVVMFQSKPLKDGMIEFFADDQTGAGTSAAIENGDWHVPKAGGLLPGKYRVEIHSGSSGVPLPAEPPGPGVRVARELIPARYNKNRRLPSTSSKGENLFDHNLTP